MNTHQIKGYCPGALNAMPSGDGLVVRIRPFNGRLSQAQASGIADLSIAYGNGKIDLSSRANIQIRGVTDNSYPALIEGLEHLELVDPNAAIESRRNILVTPYWQAGNETQALASALTQALAKEDAPNIPGKFGFAIDTGLKPVLQTASADIRLERDAAGRLLMCADGFEMAKPVSAETAVDQAIALAHWFVATRATENRMSTLLKSGVTLPSGFTELRQTQNHRAAPAATPLGTMVGIAFGQLPAEILARIAALGALRMTPWRMLLVEGTQDLHGIDGVITSPFDPFLRITACTGAPDCAQAFAGTRSLADILAPHLKPDETLHISGCTKGCAHPNPAPLTVTATPQGLDLIRGGRAGDTPALTSLTPATLIKAL